MFILEMVQGPEARKKFRLDQDSVVLGRQPDLPIVLDSRAISKRHARIWQRAGTCFIEDLGSTNGTYLNGQRLTHPEPLTEADMIQLGPYVFRLREEGAAAASDASSPAEDLVIRARVAVDPDAADLQGPAAGHQLQTVLRIGQSLSGTLKLDPLLNKLLSLLSGLFRHAGRGTIVLRRGDELAARAQSIWSMSSPGSCSLNEDTVRLALREGIAVLAGQATPSWEISSELQGMLLCAPLIGQEGLRLGAIVLEGRDGHEVFRLEDLRLLTVVALQAAAFIENAARHAELVGEPDEPMPPTPAAVNPAFSSHSVITRYPAPVALAYRRFCRQREPAARLKALFAALEATLRYLVTLGVCDLLRRLALSGAPDARLPDHLAFDFLRRPRSMTLGAWVEALRETARALAADSSSFLPELATVCAPNGPLVSQDLARLVELRNAHVHETGSLVPTPEECQEALRAARPLLEELFQKVQFICDYPLGFVQRSRGGSDPSRHRYYLHACMGTRVANTIEASAVESPVPLGEHIPFVAASDGTRLLYLWPLLLERVAGHTERHTLYVFEDIPDRHGAFLTRLRLAAIDVRDLWMQVLQEQPASDLGWLLERIRALPAAVDVPPSLRLAERLVPLSGGKLVGRTLGPNRLLAVVGVGGFSTVYAGENVKTGERVAVKVLESPEAQRHLARFRQEFERLCNASTHPNIIRCLEWGNPIIGDREYPWFSMEFAAGGDLTGRIEERHSEHPDGPAWAEPALRAEIIREFRAVASAVAHLHSLGIVHRDLKPGNVLITEDGELRLSDFGLVKDLNPPQEIDMAATLMVAPRTSTGAVLGTRHYMAPEQERGEAVEQPADVYALGVLLAELATGWRPVSNTQIRSGSTLAACSALRQLPAELHELIVRCTDAQPGRRLPNGQAVLDAFEKCVGD